jgi:Ca2+/Na+ antiporter
MKEREKQNPRLTEKEVRERLKLCTEIKVVEEIYSLGQSMLKDIVDSVRVLESKAVSFAAYGAAIVTLLISSSAAWSKLGNKLTPWICVCAGVSALICTVLAVKAIALHEHEIISQDEWLNKESLDNELKIKRYHILSIWGVMTSRIDVQARKVIEVRRAQLWLKISVAVLVVLLFQIAVLNSAGLNHGCAVSSIVGISRW